VTGSFSPGLALNLILSTALALTYLVISYLFFLRVYRHSLKTGRITRFNADEV